ncbi:kinetochore Sim4 complex subunit FTA2-domain-containing protein [Xylaria venustula]|nr:kinetochore Sim4 complex subunit FTA2-domain-containing protein [Xylaria venustula]
MAPDIDDLLLERLPIPPCEGPKLEAFEHFQNEIEFLGLLSCDPTSMESRTGHSYVFDVRIRDARFALKVFKSYDAAEARYEMSASLRRKVSDETLTFHTDPFFAECRAYGRINQYYEGLGNTAERRRGRSRSGPRTANTRLLAVPCYGYITLSADYEKLFREKFDIFDWNRPDLEDSNHVARKPFRALVKKFIPSQVSILNPRRMLGDLKKLRNLGIFVRDIYARNYKDGLLVDFSVAWTEPHWCMRAMGRYQLECEKRSDLNLFDAMIEHKKVKTVVRATRNYLYCRKLRSYDIEHASESSSEWILRHI